MVGARRGFLAAVILTGMALPAQAETVCDTVAAQFRSAETVAEARAFMANATYRNSGRGHGNQIEHATGDGRVYLWYPGNTTILPGRWKVGNEPLRSAALRGVDCSRTRLLQVCFQYGANTYNPVTGSRGAEWECTPFGVFKSSRAERVPGDPLGLAKMKTPPFPLPRTDQSIAAVKAQVGR